MSIIIDEYPREPDAINDFFCVCEPGFIDDRSCIIEFGFVIDEYPIKLKLEFKMKKCAIMGVVKILPGLFPCHYKVIKPRVVEGRELLEAQPASPTSCADGSAGAVPLSLQGD